MKVKRILAQYNRRIENLENRQREYEDFLNLLFDIILQILYTLEDIHPDNEEFKKISRKINKFFRQKAIHGNKLRWDMFKNIQDIFLLSLLLKIIIMVLSDYIMRNLI